ncbi:MAG: hypothetical protein CH6_3369 [Candidatus Kapaibacterium sp.]|nr:MAG: hypothetical protein CH6_3369 [Candidatus Kapabacteria bacterium]
MFVRWTTNLSFSSLGRFTASQMKHILSLSFSENDSIYFVRQGDHKISILEYQ